MFKKISALTSIFLAASTLVKAEVVPSEPGPGARYTAGQTCTVSWDGDKDSNTLWKDMSIQLMTGDNFAMVHITTITSGQDGTISGRFNYPCPEVTPYSTIYFYQFTSPHTSIKTWTTRFTIASPDGQVVNPENPIQPNTGAAIPWGVGKLVDASAAKPPPTIGSDEAGSVNNAAASESPVPSSSAPITSASSAASSVSSASTRPTASTSASAGNPPEDGAALASSASVKLVALAVSMISLFALA